MWVWPELKEVQPAQAAPGDEIRIVAVGGYLHWQNECGSGVDESARSFQIFVGDTPLGSMDCYVNHCEADLAVPGDLPPGTHTISVEGGSSLIIQIVGD